MVLGLALVCVGRLCIWENAAKELFYYVVLSCQELHDQVGESFNVLEFLANLAGSMLSSVDAVNSFPPPDPR